MPNPVQQKSTTVIVIGVCIVAILALVYLNNQSHEDSRRQQEAASISAEKEQQRFAERAVRFCGTATDLPCQCKGSGVVMRYLRPGMSALVKATGPIDFEPAPSPDTFKICTYDQKHCADKEGQALQVGMVLRVVNTSDKEQAITCEIKG